MTALCIALFMLGHLIRDGVPAVHSTHLARALGAFFCMAGASAVLPPLTAALVGIAILIGFYADQKHAEGQNERGWRDACYLALSGITSLVPLAVVLAWLNPWFALVALVGLAKPPLWFGAWAVNPTRWWAPAYPTRIAAIVFGAAIGAAVTVFVS